ncbi:S-glutathionyl-(chloro)hydroquinone reductase, partial [Cladochytrium tenue]
MIVRKLKGLEHVISYSVVDYLMTKDGWHFSSAEETPGAVPDSVNGAKFLREVYFKAEPAYTGRFTVPVLWDKKRGTVVNNESSEIIRMLNKEFNAWAKHPKLDLYPDNLTSEIDEVNAWVYDQINNGVYKSGFATTQTAYEKNVNILFDALDRVESLLQGKEWLVGGRFTEVKTTSLNPQGKMLTNFVVQADVRLFTTILRCVAAFANLAGGSTSS